MSLETHTHTHTHIYIYIYILLVYDWEIDNISIYKACVNSKICNISKITQLIILPLSHFGFSPKN